MTGEQFRAIRLRLDPKDQRFAPFIAKKKKGPGRPPKTAEVTQDALAAHLGLSGEQVGRYERGVTPISRQIELLMECLDPGKGSKLKAKRAK